MFMMQDPAHSALGAFPPLVQRALQEVMVTTGVPVEIAILEALSSLSTCLRDFTLETPSGQLMSTQLFCIGVAGVTCGKGQALRKLFKPIRDVESRGSVGCEEVDRSELERESSPSLVVDATWPALLEHLHGVDKSITVLDEDAVDLLAAPMLKSRGRLNRMFDSPDSESMLRRDKRFDAHRPTLGLCLLVQPDVFAEYLQRTSFKDRQTGLAARCFYAYSFAARSRVFDHLATPALEALNRAQSALLSLGRLDRPGRRRHRLSLGADALNAWQQIKMQLASRACGDLADISDAVGRATEKCWRVATLLHAIARALVFQGEGLLQALQEPINADCIWAAWCLVEWSFCEYRKVLPLSIRRSTVQVRQSEEIRLAIWHIQSHLFRTQVTTTTVSLARDLSGLSGHKFKFVLAHLRSAGAVKETSGKNPSLLFQPSFWIGSEFPPVLPPPVALTPMT